MTGPYRVRPFSPEDAECVGALFDDYMFELFDNRNAMTPAVLRQAVGSAFQLKLATRGSAIVGFAAHLDTYDLHNAVSGSEISDLFVSRTHRGRGVALRLVAAIAREVHAGGGTYVRGETLENDAARLRLVRRLAVGFPAETVYLSGLGLRTLAELADADIRQMVRGLPSMEQSREP